MDSPTRKLKTDDSFVAGRSVQNLAPGAAFDASLRDLDSTRTLLLLYVSYAKPINATIYSPVTDHLSHHQGENHATIEGDDPPLDHQPVWYGTLSRGPSLINDVMHSRARAILTGIHNGDFAREWSDEQASGALRLQELRQRALNHPMSLAEDGVIAAVQAIAKRV